jgi:hypothetical protein
VSALALKDLDIPALVARLAERPALSVAVMPAIGKDDDEAAQRSLAAVERWAPRARCGVMTSPDLAEAVEWAGEEDLVLLRAGAEVGPGWATGLILAAYCEDGIATSSAIAAGPAIVSLMDDPLASAPDEAFLGVARLAAHTAKFVWTALPAPEGPCVYVRRTALDGVAPARRDGIVRGADWATALAALLEGRGRYVAAPRAMVRWDAEGPALADSDAGRLAKAAAATPYADPAVLYLRDRARPLDAPRLDQGTAAFEPDAVVRGQHVLVAEAVEGRALVLKELVDARLRRRAVWRPAGLCQATELCRDDYAATLADWLIRGAIEDVVVVDPSGAPLTMGPETARRLEIPVVWSLNDHTPLCPLGTLVDGDGVACGGHCTASTRRCLARGPWEEQVGDPVRGAALAAWRHTTGRLFGLPDGRWPDAGAMAGAGRRPAARGAVTAVVLPGRAAQTFWRRWLAGFGGAVRCVPPGSRVRPTTDTGRVRKAGPWRLALLREPRTERGRRFVHDVAAALGFGVEWHIMAQQEAAAGWAGRGVVHHPTGPDGLADAVADADPDYALVVPDGPEPYCEALDEAWDLHLPVIGADTGDLGERLRSYGGGLLFPCWSVAGAVGAILRAFGAAPGGLSGRRVELPAGGTASRALAVEGFAGLVRSPGPRPGRRGARSLPAIGLIGVDYAAGSVRMDRPALKATAMGLADFRYTTARDIASGRDTTAYAAVLAEADVIPVEDIAGLVGALGERGARLVLDTDTDRFSDAAEYWSERTAWSARGFVGMRYALEHADTVLAGTEALARRLRRWAPGLEVAVVPDRLDARLWRPAAGRPTARGNGDGVVVLYLAERDGRPETDMVAALPGLLGGRLGRKVTIDVVGGHGGRWPVGFRKVPAAELEPGAGYETVSCWLCAQAGRWVLGIAPLTDHWTNECRGDTRLFEYAALGLPAVASQWGPYQAAGDLAVLCADGPGAWADAGAALITGRGEAAGLERRAAARRALAGRMLDAESVRRWVGLVLGRGEPRRPDPERRTDVAA